MPRSNKIQRTEPTSPAKFTDVPVECFSIIFQHCLNDAQTVSTLRQTCRQFHAYSKHSLPDSYKEISVITYRELKIHFEANKHWHPTIKPPGMADLLLQMPRLRKMDLSDIPMRDVRKIFQKKIRYLDSVQEIVLERIGRSHLPSADFQENVQALPSNLKQLAISFTTSPRIEVLNHVAKLAPNLIALKLPNVTLNGVGTGFAFARLGQCCKELQFMDFGRFPLLTSDMHELRNCAKVTHIKAGSLHVVFLENLITNLPQTFPQLRSLDLTLAFTGPFHSVGYACIKGEWIEAILIGCPHLEELGLSYSRFDGKVLETLVEHGQNLRILDLRGLHSLKEEEVVEIIAKCTNLQTLILDNSGQKFMSNPIIRDFQQKSKNAKK